MHSNFDPLKPKPSMALQLSNYAPLTGEKECKNSLPRKGDLELFYKRIKPRKIIKKD
jgi:hypothetical protein